MPDEAIITIRDYSNELTRTKINTVDITAANLAAQTALLTTLVNEISPIINGNIAEWRFKVVTPGASTPPSNAEAQIEKGWLVHYVDNSPFLDPGTDLVPNPGYGEPFTMTWYTADYTGHLVLNTDLADLTNADVIAFVDAFEDLYVSPYGGVVVVTSIEVVGVNR